MVILMSSSVRRISITLINCPYSSTFLWLVFDWWPWSWQLRFHCRCQYQFGQYQFLCYLIGKLLLNIWFHQCCTTVQKSLMGMKWLNDTSTVYEIWDSYVPLANKNSNSQHERLQSSCSIPCMARFTIALIPPINLCWWQSPYPSCLPTLRCKWWQDIEYLTPADWIITGSLLQ